jgi:hypothetical protein
MRTFLITLAIALAVAPAAPAATFSPWQPAVNAESLPGTASDLNTPALEGCPAQSPDGLSLYLASTRPRFPGDARTDIDIWVARRDRVGDPWGTPVNLGAPVNSAADDFCPTPVRGHGLFFVSRRVVSGVTCGAGDIYLTRFTKPLGWRTPEHLDCAADGGPNTALDEQGPSYVEAEAGGVLYFSSGPDIHRAPRDADGEFGPGAAVAELNTAASDIQPNVRKDGRELVFASNRNPVNGQDIWVSTRANTDEPWSPPVNLGPAVNTAANETRPSFSWDAETLYFGRTPGQESAAGDLFVAARSRLP